MVILSIEQSLLALAEGSDESFIDVDIARTKKLLENMDVYKELTPSVCDGFVAACKSMEAVERILGVLLHSFIVKPNSESAHFICRVITSFQNDLSMTSEKDKLQEDLLVAASNIVVQDSPFENAETYIEALLQVAQAQVRSGNEGTHILALVFAYFLHTISRDHFDENFVVREKEVYWRNDFVDLLANKIFGLGSKCDPATLEEINLLSPIIRNLTEKELGRCLMTPFQNKPTLGICGSVVTWCAVFSRLDEGKKKNLLFNHLNHPPNLSYIVITFMLSGKPSEISTGFTLLEAITKAVPLAALRSITNKLVDELNKSFNTDENERRIAIYQIFNKIGQNWPFEAINKSNMKELRECTESIISTISYALEKEEEREEFDEECIFEASNSNNLWTGITEKLYPSSTALSSSTPAVEKTTVEETDQYIKSRSRVVMNTVPTANLLGDYNQEENKKHIFDPKPEEHSQSSNLSSNKIRHSLDKLTDPILEDRIKSKSSLDLLSKTKEMEYVKHDCNEKPMKTTENPEHLKEINHQLMPLQENTSLNSLDCKKSDQIVFDVEESGLASYTVNCADGVLASSNGLVTAMAIEDDKYDVPISYAQTFEEKIPFHKNKRVITYTIGLIFILIIGVTGASLMATKKVLDMGIVTDSPSKAPSAPPTTRRDSIGIWERLSELSGPALLLARAGDTELQETPQFKAAEWLINEDQRQLDAYDDLLEQRYVLALIYFSTKGHKWKECSFDLEITECSYYDFSLQSTFTESRYLSATHECEWFQTYCSDDRIVRNLHLYNNNLNGTIPSEIAALTKLRSLRLNLNSLTGYLPTELGSLRHLTRLEIHANKIQGTLPVELFNIDTLQSLNVAMNGFEGTIPDRFDNLKNLKGIHMFENSFTGTIPVSMGQMPYLSFVYLYGNKLTGTVPSALYRRKRMKQILLNQNRLTGTLPSDIGQMKDIEILKLNDNNFEGTLPEELYRLDSLQWLYLQSNNFSGSISSNIGNMKNLNTILFRLNEFTGTIPIEIGNLTKLELLWVHFNKFEGSMPDQVCELTNSGLGSLYADCLDDFGNALVECNCCTDCCDHDQETCYEVQ